MTSCLLRDILQLFVDSHDENTRQAYRKAVTYSDTLTECLGADTKVINITTSDLDRYKSWRREHKNRVYKGNKITSKATVNRELSALKRSFRLGLERGIVAKIPHFPMYKEDNVRTGVLQYWELLKLRDALPDYLKPVVLFAFKSAWRKGEILALQWHNVDIVNGSIYIEPQKTKSHQGRTYYLDKEMHQMFKELYKKAQKNDKDRPDDNVFPNKNGKGKIRDFRVAWKTALKKAELPENIIFHDLRRSAIVALVEAGNTEKVVMSISGHKTTSVFHRYFITSEKIMRGATERMREYLDKQMEMYNSESDN